MFAVVKIIENEKSFKGRLRYFLKKPKPMLERVTVGENSYFYYLRIHAGQVGEGYSYIKELLGKYAARVIPCDKYSFKTEGLVSTVRISGYYEKLLINTALSILKSRGYDKNKKRICLIDKNGAYFEILKLLMQYSSSLSVVTENAGAYSQACRELLEEWGISVVITDEINSLSKYDFVISPDFGLNKLFNNTVIIKNDRSDCYDVLKGSDVKLPDSIRFLMPEGVNKLDFAYSLYTYCSLEEMGKLSFSDFKVISSVK